MRRGEIWWVQLPFTSGRVQAGLRPAVIVQHDRHTAPLPTVLIVPFTSNLRTRRFPGTLVVQPDGRNGLTAPSVALGFQLKALDQNDVLQHLGILDQTTLDKIIALVDTLIR
jgi:mRNA interferase MazF